MYNIYKIQFFSIKTWSHDLSPKESLKINKLSLKLLQSCALFTLDLDLSKERRNIKSA